MQPWGPALEANMERISITHMTLPLNVFEQEEGDPDTAEHQHPPEGQELGFHWRCQAGPWPGKLGECSQD